jgi:hypothetical protein
MNYIFEDIVETQSILLIIEEHFEDAAERTHMKNLVKDTIHHKVLDLVLDELDAEHKLLLLAGIEDETQHQSLLERLKDWIEGFEDKIRFRAKEAETELIQLITVG